MGCAFAKLQSMYCQQKYDLKVAREAIKKLGEEKLKALELARVYEKELAKARKQILSLQEQKEANRFTNQRRK